MVPSGMDGDEAFALSGVLSQTVFVYDAREDILAHAAFTGDEYAEVGGSHLNGFVDGEQQFGVVANDAVS